MSKVGGDGTKYIVYIVCTLYLGLVVGGGIPLERHYSYIAHSYCWCDGWTAACTSLCHLGREV